MKLPTPIKRASRTVEVRAFTLAEMMIVVAVFSFIIAAICAVQLFALRVYTLGATKLSATMGARQTLNAMRDRIRSSKIAWIGTYSNGSGFARVPLGLQQMGNALELATTNGNATNFMVYYLDTWDPTNTLFSYGISNNLSTPLTVEAKYVTNFYCFYGENYQGTNTTDYENNTVIHVLLQFYQWEYPLGFIGTNAINAYNFYNISARIMRRASD
jgi:prepilin-type N-terminal cleavage/methylation domain-containing protein